MIEITDTAASMQDKLTIEFYKLANARIKRNAPIGLAQAKATTLAFLISTDTYQSLVSDELAYHFGFIKGTEERVLRPILNTFVESIHYEFIPFSKTGGSFTFFGISDDYADVLALPQAYIQGKNRSKFTTEYPLPWLNWLLLQGDEILVKDHKISIGAISGRSGEAVMIEGGTWSIPSRFRGTPTNNWVTKMSPKGTKAISDYDITMQKILEGLLV
tara:strand:- start:4611 stop:5261 length:651 start_codon:yes stop_codon:yes gene_type:complete